MQICNKAKYLDYFQNLDSVAENTRSSLYYRK